jgi:hypothetical protein
MNVNDLFGQIGDFWDSISIPILFHLIFWGLYIFIFGRYSLRNAIDNYIKSPGFTQTKKILEEFELWKKLPFILGLLGLIYFSVFNNLANVLTAPRVFPMDVSYTQAAFMEEYQAKDEILFIASYQPDSTANSTRLDEFQEQLVQEYKTKFPDDYRRWVKWADDEFGKRYRYLQLSILTLAVLIFFYFRNMFQKKREHKVKSTLKFILVLMMGLSAVFIFRYRAEQAIEERFGNQLVFVANSLRGDSTKIQKLTGAKMTFLKDKLDRESVEGHFVSVSSIWVSRWVEQCPILEFFLGRRRLGKR